MAAEEVGAEAAGAFLDFHRKSAAFDPHLADQLVLYLSLSREDSSFTTSCITEHLLTNLWVIKKVHGYSLRGGRSIKLRGKNKDISFVGFDEVFLPVADN